MFRLRPHHQNFHKRLIKTPKLYFCDTGLAAWLLGIREAPQMAFHAQRGSLFENLAVGEFLKGRHNRGLPPDLHFWRDSQGLEVDLLVETAGAFQPVEIKSGQTVVPDFFHGLSRWSALSGQADRPGMLVYGGEQSLKKGSITIVPWRDLGRIT